MITVESYASINEAASAMGARATYMAGGTLVMRTLNYGEQTFERIVRTNDKTLKQISVHADRITLGAGLTMSDVLNARDLEFLAPVARSIGGPAVRNMATIGGNLFAAHPYGDFGVALLALDGQVQFADGSQEDMERFYATRNTQAALVSSISIARPSGSDFRYAKVSRVKPKGVSVLSMAAWLPIRAGRLAQPRIAFGAMAATPQRARNAEQALDGGALGPTEIQTAVGTLDRDYQPPDDALASSWYRTQVAPVHLRRLLADGGHA